MKVALKNLHYARSVVNICAGICFGKDKSADTKVSHVNRFLLSTLEIDVMEHADRNSYKDSYAGACVRARACVFVSRLPSTVSENSQNEYELFARCYILS